MPGTTQTIGTLTYRAGTQNNQILANFYESLNVANQAESLNHDPFDDFVGLQYWCNNNLSNDSDFVVFDDGIATSQGNQNATLNTFSHVTMDFNNMGLNGNGPNGEIDYSHDGSPEGTPQPGLFVGITPIFSASPVDCSVGGNGGSNDGGGSGGLTPQDEQALTNDFNTAKSNFDQQVQTYNSLPPGDPQVPVLERQMAESKGTMQRIADRILRSELSDTVSFDLPKIRTWLYNKESLEAEYSVVESYLYEGDSVLARMVRDSIPVKYTLSAAQTAEHADFVQLSELAINITAGEQELLSLNTATLDDVIDMADNGTGMAAAKAQGLLNFGYGYNYVLIPKVYSNPQESAIPPGIQQLGRYASAREIVARPNPAKGEVAFDFRMPEGMEAGVLEVTDTNGRVVFVAELTSGSGRIAWDSNGLPPGIYFYRAKYTNRASPVHKLILAH